MKVGTRGIIRLLAAAALAMSACATGDADVGKTVPAFDDDGPTLNTFIEDSIQIDELAVDNPDPKLGDANLVTGNDLADGTASRDWPTGGPGVFIDWDDLAADIDNHKLPDLDNSSGRDPTSFPRSNECVGDSNVLSKMDLTYVAAANNTEYAYFGVQRSDNNGDAGYYWLFTKLAPTMELGAGPCRDTEERLTYDISGPNGGTGDVLLVGHFKPSSGPLIRVFQARESRSGVPAVDAVDYKDDTLWLETPEAIAAAAVNTTPTDAGAFGAEGVKASSGSTLEKEVFAEAAVDLSIFTGDSLCGATYYGSVISRSSGSGGTSPDLKDLAGPAVFNFGDISATAELTPTCQLSFHYAAGATGMDGEPILNPECTWTFDDGFEVTGCSGQAHEVPAGSRTGTVTVRDPVSGCENTVTTNEITLYPELTLETTLEASCALSFSYLASVSGGSPTVSYAWTFTGPGEVVPPTSNIPSGSASVSEPGEYTGALVVTDLRTDLPPGTCTVDGGGPTHPYAPVGVSLQLQGNAPSCPGMSSDAVTYDAIVTGGSGSVTHTWHGPACSGANCTVGPMAFAYCGDMDLSVTVSDRICGSATSETETYSKVTTVTATDN